MNERDSPYLPSIGLEAELQYQHASYNADARRELYKYAPLIDAETNDPSTNIWEKVAKELHLRGDERIMDVGTGWGSFLDLLGSKFNHQGDMLGIDKYDEQFASLSWALESKNHHPNIVLMPGDAEDLRPLPDDYVDVLSALFLMYHLEHPDKALAEFKRVLRPGGTLVVASRGPMNHERMWRLAGLVADRVGAYRPQQYYPAFDIKKLGRP